MSMITVKQLTKAFDGKEVVKDLNFNLTPGKCVALLGPNGAGKTTTLRMIAGISKPTRGSIKIEGKLPNEDIRSSIGYLPQFPVFHNWMSGKEFLVYVGQLARLSKSEANKRAEDLLNQIGLKDDGKRRIGNYSGGMKQRLGIAQALIHQPKLLMLDEPASSLDPIGRREVLDLIRTIKDETTVLFSTHILKDAEDISDEILLLKNGLIVESGTLDGVKQKYTTEKIELTFQQLPENAFSLIKNIASLYSVKVEGDSLFILANDIAAARNSLLELIAKNKWPVTHFEVGRTTLEDLFMKVVNV